jgi:ribonuclease E
MANKMLIDATHPEETRVVVLRGNRVEEFDFETAHRKQLRGNIYLAKVTRVEPSLQAAFVEYGGNRHGFLAFSEIHPDYYQIPVADRQALIDADARAARDDEEADDHHRGSRRPRGRNRHRERPHSRRDETVQSDPLTATDPAAGDSASDTGTTEPEANQALEQSASESTHHDDAHASDAPAQDAHDAHGHDDIREHADHEHHDTRDESSHEQPQPIAEGENPPVPAEIGTPVEPTLHTESEHHEAPASEHDAPSHQAGVAGELHDTSEAGELPAGDGNGTNGHDEEEEVVDTVGGADAMEEVLDRAPRYRRQYKIQEVIKRRQVMLVQVVKEERGTKGAALTTYLSLAGRYCVLMPNTARGGGISRKITSAEDRKKLREIAEELEVPEGMGVILRTAGAARTKAEVKRDFEYLLRIWEQVRDLTLKSTAPTLVYEEGSLAKRSIRDLYTKDIDEIIVAGDQGYKDAKEFMRMLMPSHAKNVKLYNDSQPIYTRYGIESQLDAMFSPTVQLRSGGYIVLNQTEALVSIDVNSGRSTREHHIEDTALKTNCEAAEEVARQLRLRDLAGLIVIDFIDMDEKRNNRTVERRLKDALRNDRARIQVGRISHFGLLEMSRQRIRTSVLESSTEKCPHCGGTGHVRSVSSVALQLLRSIEETLLKGPTHNLIIRTRPEIALYVLNHKRAHLRGLEERFCVSLTVNADEEVGGATGFTVDRGEQVMTIEQAKALLVQATADAPVLHEDEEPEFVEEADESADAESDAGESETSHESHGEISEISADSEDHQPVYADAGRDGEMSREGGRGRRRRRRRGRGGRGGGEGRDGIPYQPQEHGASEAGEFANEPADGQSQPEGSEYTPGEMPSEHEYASPHAEANGDGEARRRRRGRRGGRRNRRERNGNGDFTAMQGEEIHARPDYSERPESSLPAFQADTGHHNTEQVSPPPFEAPPQPAPAPQFEAALPPPPAPPAEPQRRRSTVREPAPIFGSSEPVVIPASPPAPTVISTADADDTAKPKRSGWWAKRLLGGDKG